MKMDTREIFSIRKFKTGTHSALLTKYGIALATTATLMGAGVVSADEATPTPAAEQTAVSNENALLQTSDPQENPVAIPEGDIVTAEPNDNLQNALSSADEAGLDIKQGDTQTVANAEEANTDYDKQAEAISQTVQQYQKDVSANQDGLSRLNAAIENAKNQGVIVDVVSKVVKTASETDYDKQIQAINQIVADYKSALSSAEALNKQLDDLMEEAKKAGFTFNVTTKTFTANSKTEAATKAQDIQTKLDQYRKDLAAYEAKVKALEEMTIQKDGDIVIAGQFNEDQRGFDFYKDIKVVYVGDDQSVTLVDKLGWTDETVATDAKGLEISAFDNGTGRGYSSNAPSGTTIVSSVTGKYLLTNISDGSSLVLKNVGKYQNGKTIDLLLTFKINSEHKGKTDKLMPYLVMGYDLGETYKPISFEMMSMDHVTVDFTYLDENGNKVKVLDARVISDVDWGQTSNAKMSQTYGLINPTGSRLTEDSNGLKADVFGADGMATAPAGTFIYYGIGDTFTYDHYTGFDEETGKYKTVPAGAFVEFSLFGSAGQITQELFIKPTPVKIDVVKYSVEKPSVKATTYTIEKPVVDYHLNAYSKPTPPTPPVETPPVTPEVVKVAVLPKTGEHQSKWSLAGLAIVGLLGLGLSAKRKETE